MNKKDSEETDTKKKSNENEDGTKATEDAEKPTEGAEDDGTKPTENDFVRPSMDKKDDFERPTEGDDDDNEEAGDSKDPGKGTATKADDDKPTESDIEGGGGGGNDAANEDGAPSKVPSEVKENLSHDDDPVREDPPEEDRVSDHNDPLPDKEKDKEMEEKAELEDEAADRRRKRKCKNCDRATCADCCKKGMTALVFFLLVACLTAAFFACLMAFYGSLIKDDAFVFENVILMHQGPQGGVVAPKLSCEVNGQKHRCERYPLGGIPPMCGCNKTIFAQDLWIALNHQKEVLDTMQQKNFKEAGDYSTAKKNVEEVINKCAPSGIDDIKNSYLKEIQEGHFCFLIGLNRILNWVPEAEIDVSKVGVADALQKIDRTNTTSPVKTTLQWLFTVKEFMHHGLPAEEATEAANQRFGIAVGYEGGHKPKNLKSVEEEALERLKRKPAGSKWKLDNVASSVPKEAVGKYVPVLCEAEYPGFATRVALPVYPKEGIFIPGYNVYKGNQAYHRDTVAAIVLPKKLYAEIATVECVFVARNMEYRTTHSGNLEFMFSYVA